MGARHVLDGLDPLLQPAQRLVPDNPLPYYLATNLDVVRPVKQGAILTGADVALPEGSTLLRLRREQDALFDRHDAGFDRARPRRQYAAYNISRGGGSQCRPLSRAATTGDCCDVPVRAAGALRCPRLKP